MAFVEELRALTEELESLNDRIAQLHESRSIPTDQLIVTTESDDEAVQLAADWNSYNERYSAFMQREIDSRGL